MKRISVNNIVNKENIDLIKEIISNDGIFIYPTDTLYGIGGNFFSLHVMEKIDSLKNRSDMPYSAAVSGIDMIEKLVENIPDKFYEIKDELLPGKFTFLFRVSSSLDQKLVKNRGKIGIRIPDLPKILELIRILNVPFISTSVNRSGEKPLNDPDRIVALFDQIGPEQEPSLLIDAGILPESRGSTIIDLTEHPPRVIRQGDCSWKQ